MIVGIEVDNFFHERGANKPCPSWIIPQGENWAWYSEYDDGLNLDESGLSCTGQKSKGGNLNPLCEGCPLKGKVFPEVTSHNYLQVLYQYPK